MTGEAGRGRATKKALRQKKIMIFF